MSRTVSAPLLAAINAPTSYDIKARATIHKSLMAFSSLDRDYQPSDFYEGVPDYQHKWVGTAAYFAGISKATNAFIDGGDGSLLKFYCNPNAGVIVPTFSGSARNVLSPSIIDGYLYAIEGGVPYRFTINTSALSSNNPACLSARDSLGGSGASGIVGISSTEAVVFTITNQIGYTVRYYTYSGSWIYKESEDSITFPTAFRAGHTYTRFTATKLGDKVFAYVTDPKTGAVMAKVLDTGTVSGGRNWSSTFTAVPSDMSEFWPSSCFVANGKVHMSGIFRRTEDFASGNYYNLLMSSNDGRSFSMDRFTMVTNLPGMYACCTSGTVLYGMCCGGVGESPANYVVGSPTASLVIPDEDILTINYNVQSPGGQGAIKVANGDRTYDDNTYLEEGNRLQLELGYSTTGGDDYELMETFIITQVAEGIGDGENSLTLQIQTEGAWRLANQTAPFYTEMDSNTADIDSVTNDLDHLYAAPLGGRAVNGFYVDMWNSSGWDLDSSVTPLDMMVDGGPETVISAGSHSYAMLTANIAGKNSLADNPVIEEAPIYVSIYGWSRTPSTGLSVDTVKLFLVLDDGGENTTYYDDLPFDPDRYKGMPFPDPEGITLLDGGGNIGPGDDGGGNISRNGDLGIKERLDGFKVVKGTLISSTDTWPHTYYDVAAGNEPIVFGWDSTKVAAGDKIVKIGIVIDAPNATAFNIAGCEISATASPGVVGILRWEDTNTPWTKQDNHLELPDSGRPFVMFATKTYYSFNFDVSARFTHATGGSPAVNNGDANVGFGVLGHAKDSQNYVLGKVNILANKLQIILLRHGRETVLAEAAFTLPSSVCWIRMTHRDGTYKLFVRTSDDAKSWGSALVTYNWVSKQQIIGDTIYVNDRQIDTYSSFVGIYGMKHGASFRTCGFNRGDAEGIGLMPGESMSGFGDFPASGEIVVNGSRYAFAGKTSVARIPIGPWRGEATRVVDSGSHQGTGVEIPYFDWGKAADYWEGFLLSLESGHTWIISKTGWRVAVLVDGAPDYGDRIMSRHICDKASGDYATHSTKVVVGPGIINIKARDDVSASHPYGSFVNLYISNKIRLHYFEASGGDGDMTVADMVTRICETAGVKAEFPGDITHASQGLTGTPWTLRQT